MDLAGRLQRLEQLILDAKSMPLSSSVLVNREEVMQMLAEMQESLPEEIKQARWIVKDREDLLTKARAEGERIVEQAHEEQRRMALKEEVARRAEAEAQSILENAQDRADAMLRDAEDYVDAKLAQFEITLRKILEDTQGTARSVAKTLDQVEVGRERLRAPATVAEQELAPPPQVETTVPTDLYDEQDAANGTARGAGGA
jgi:cell division septum initiation protein DivIVA